MENYLPLDGHLKTGHIIHTNTIAFQSFGGHLTQLPMILIR